MTGAQQAALAGVPATVAALVTFGVQEWRLEMKDARSHQIELAAQANLEEGHQREIAYVEKWAACEALR